MYIHVLIYLKGKVKQKSLQYTNTHKVKDWLKFAIIPFNRQAFGTAFLSSSINVFLSMFKDSSGLNWFFRLETNGLVFSTE